MGKQDEGRGKEDEVMRGAGRGACRRVRGPSILAPRMAAFMVHMGCPQKGSPPTHADLTALNMHTDIRFESV